MTEHWAAEITKHLKERFGLSVFDAKSIDKGWLHVKWRMLTDEGPLFVKVYHPERYHWHLRPERRCAIEKTLELQHGMSAAGIPCPSVYHIKGQFIQETASGLLYTILDWVEGHTVQAGCLNSAHRHWSVPWISGFSKQLVRLSMDTVSIRKCLYPRSHELCKCFI